MKRWLSALAVLVAACGSTRSVTIVQDIDVTIDGRTDRSPLGGPSARLAAAAKEVREMLGHPLAIEIDASLAPERKEDLDFVLTRVLEGLATGLTREEENGQPTLEAAKRLRRISIRYAPGAIPEQSGPRFDGNDTVVVTLRAKSAEIIPVGDVLWLLRDSGKKERGEAFEKWDPRAIPAENQQAYARWLRDASWPGATEAERRKNELEQIHRALLFEPKVAKSEDREEVRRLLIDGALRDLAWNRYGDGPEVAAISNEVAVWLESSYEAIGSSWRGRALEVLLGRGVKYRRFLDSAEVLAVRSIDAWRAAGHPVQGRGTQIPTEYEVSLCPHPKDGNDRRSLAPNCDGGIVRLLLASDAGQKKLGEILASRRDPALVEHIVVSAGYSSYGGGERAVFALIRAVESDPPSLRMALRVLAEDQADHGNADVWVSELRRLWLAKPGARGTILYVLGHLDQYESGKVDFADFAGDFGARVSAEEMSAYLDEGYRSISLLPIVWPALAPGFSRAALLRPRLDAYLDNPLVRMFSMQDPYETLVRIHHRLCEEGSYADLRALSSYFAERVQKRPGHGMDDMSKFYDRKTCDPPCAKTREGTCAHWMRGR